MKLMILSLIIVFITIIFMTSFVIQENFEERNVFLYWTGKDNNLILLLRDLIYKYSKKGRGYQVFLFNENNIKKYFKLPKNFNNLKPAHQADFIRVEAVCQYGGIWLDADTLILDKLDSLFDILDNHEGFFITEKPNGLCNGVFGSRKNTDLMINWRNLVNEKINDNLNWTSLGGSYLTDLKNSNSPLLKNYKIFNGSENMYPVNWNEAHLFFEGSYEKILRNYQPLIILVNSVYKKFNDKSRREILSQKYPLNYFINKSLKNNI